MDFPVVSHLLIGFIHNFLVKPINLENNPIFYLLCQPLEKVKPQLFTILDTISNISYALTLW